MKTEEIRELTDRELRQKLEDDRQELNFEYLTKILNDLVEQNTEAV